MNKSKLRWTLDQKIQGLATVLLLLLGGVSSYFYFEINEISREIEEISQSDFPLYETATQLVVYQKEQQLLFEELDNLYDSHLAEKPGFFWSQIAYKLARLEQEISKTLWTGIKQSQWAHEEEQNKEDKIRLNQEQEDYQQLKSIFLKLQFKHQQFNLIVEQLLQPTFGEQTSPQTAHGTSEPASLSVNLIQQARLELQVSEQLTQEILQRLKAHIDGSVSATVEERTLAIRTNALIAFAALLFGLFFSSVVTRQITSSVQKVTEQAKFIADNIERESLTSEALVIDTNDEIGDLSVAFNRMVDNFLSSQAERKQMAEQILSEKKMAQWQANHDVLTGLVNRRKFEHQLSQILETDYTSAHGLLYLDLDRFKIINDTCGHSAGDELLRQVSQVFQSQIRRGATRKSWFWAKRDRFGHIEARKNWSLLM